MCGSAADFSHIGLGEFGKMISLTKSMPQFRYLVVAVVLVGANFQVVNIHASGIVAQVHDDHAVWDRAELKLIDSSMGAHQSPPPPHLDRSVPTGAYGAGPRDTSIAVGSSKPFRNAIFKGWGLRLPSMAFVGAEVRLTFLGWQDNAILATHFAWRNSMVACRLMVAFARAEFSTTSIKDVLKDIKRRSAHFASSSGLGFESSRRAFCRAETPLTSIEVPEGNADCTAASFTFPVEHGWHLEHSIVDKRLASLYSCSHVHATGDLAKVGAN